MILVYIPLLTRARTASIALLAVGEPAGRVGALYHRPTHCVLPPTFTLSVLGLDVLAAARAHEPLTPGNPETLDLLDTTGPRHANGRTERTTAAIDCSTYQKAGSRLASRTTSVLLLGYVFLVSILRGHKGVRLVGVPPPSKASSKLHTKAVCEHRHEEFVHQQEPAVSLWPFAAQAAVDGLSAYVFEGRVPAHILQRAAKQRMQCVAARRHALRCTGLQLDTDDEYSSTDNEMVS